MDNKQKQQSDIVLLLLLLCLLSSYQTLHSRFFASNSIFEYVLLVVFFVLYASLSFVHFRKNSTMPLCVLIILLLNAIVASIGCGVSLFGNVMVGVILVLLGGIVNAGALLLYVICYLLYRSMVINRLYLVSVRDLICFLPIWIIPFLMNNIIVL